MRLCPSFGGIQSLATSERMLRARPSMRGAHSRSDFPKQRDDYGLFNSNLRRGSNDRPEIEKKPVAFTRKSLAECQQYRKG